MPTGARTTGMAAGSPASIVEVSMFETSFNTRCLMRIFWKSPTLLASVISSLAPPSM